MNSTVKWLRGAVVMAAVSGTCVALAVPTAKGSAYVLDQSLYQEDNAYDGLLPQQYNLLRAEGVSFSFDNVNLSAYNNGKGYNGGSYYENQALDYGCLTDGKIPLHKGRLTLGGKKYGDEWNDHWEDRLLIPENAQTTWTWTTPKLLQSVKIYTQWPDGNRNDVSVKAIEVRDGDGTWTTLPYSTFDFSMNQGLNTGLTDTEYLGSSTHNRVVTFEDLDAGFLAEAVTGLRITYGDQAGGLCYGCYWEVEAEGRIIAPGVVDPVLTASGGCATITGSLIATDDLPGTLVVKYGRPAEGLVHEVEVTPEATATLLGYPFTAQLAGLPLDAEIVYALEYAEDGEVISARTNSFRTVEDYHLLPGLWQARLSGKFNLTDALADSDNGVNRTLGPVMGLTGFSDSNSFQDAYYENFDGTKFYWGYQKTYLYQGYIWLEAGVKYWFCTLQDDNGFIAIDGAQVVRSDGWDKSAQGALTPTYTGWHPIDIRSGNDGGNAGLGSGSMLGFGIAVGGDDAPNAYRNLLDAGDGRLFGCCVGDGGCMPITVEGALLNGDCLSANVTVDVSGGYELYALYSADYETWTTNATPLVENELGVVVVNGLPADTLYVRFLAVLGGDPQAVRYSPSVYLPETETIGENPVFALGSAIRADVDGIGFSLTILDLGANATGWTAKLVYWCVEGQESEFALASGNAIGVFEVAPKGMLPGMAYQGKVVVENSEGATAESATFAFTTAALDECDLVYVPGLRQGKTGCASDGTADYTITIDDLDADQVDTTLGLLLGTKEAQGDENDQPSVRDAACRRSWAWDAKNSAFYYEGQIYLHANTPIYVESKFDDGVAIFIDDVCVYDEYVVSHDSGYNTKNNYTCGSFTPAATGWYNFRAYLWDWSGGKTIMHGVAAAQWTEDSSAVNVDGGTVTAKADKVNDATLWHPFYDDGTGSFLRRAVRVAPRISIDAQALTDAGLTATLGFEAGLAAGALHVVYGDEYGGDGAWDADVTLAQLAAGTTTYDYGPLAGVGETVKYVRFYLEQPEGRAWSETICCVDAQTPVFGTSFAVTGMSAGDSLVVSGALTSLGGSACEVTVELSRTGDFTDTVIVPVGDFAAPANFTQTLHNEDKSAPDYIQPGEVVYVRAKAVNGDGTVGITPVQCVCPKGEMVLGQVTASTSLWDYTISAKIVDAGMGENPTVELYIDGQLVDSQVVADGQTYVYSGSAENMGDYTYQLVGRNSCSTASSTVSSDEYSFTLTDKCLYFWKASVTDGDWSNPDNWVRDGSDSPRQTFPNASTCVARFDNCTSPTTIRIDGKYSVSLIGMGDHRNLQLTFAGVGVPGTDNKLDVYHSDDGMVFAPGTDLTLSNLYLEGHCKFNPKADSKTRVLYGSVLQFHREYWWLNGATDTLLELRGQSRLCISGWSMRAQGGSGQVIVDDSTIEVLTSGLQFENTQSENDSIDFLFMGANPRLKGTTMDIRASNCATFTFVVPAEGFAEPVITCLSGASTFNANAGVTTPVFISEDSPARLGSVNTKLIDWPNGIAPQALDFSAQPQKVASCATCYWTYGADNALEPETDGAQPTGLWLTMKAAGLVIFIR